MCASGAHGSRFESGYPDLNKDTMKNKTLLFDIDGVLNNGTLFSLRYTKKYNVPMSLLLPFFKGPFQKCLVGEADLKEELEKVIPIWGYKGTVEELLKFWLDGELNINTELKGKLLELKKSGWKLIACTNQEKYRTQFFIEKLELSKIFDKVYSSAYLGLKKPDSRFYQHILDDQNTSPTDIYFWDDDIENIEGAKAMGINTYLFEGNDGFYSDLKKLGVV